MSVLHEGRICRSWAACANDVCLQLGVRDKVPDRRLEAARQAGDLLPREVAAFHFEFLQVGAVHPRRVGESLDCQPAGIAQAADSAAKVERGRLGCGHPLDIYGWALKAPETIV